MHARHRSTFTKNPIKNLHHHLDLEQFHPQENRKKSAEIVPFCGFVSCEVSAVVRDPLKCCQMSNLSIDTRRHG